MSRIVFVDTTGLTADLNRDTHHRWWMANNRDRQGYGKNTRVAVDFRKLGTIWHVRSQAGTQVDRHAGTVAND